MRRFLAAFAAAFALTLTISATPAQAHNHICNTFAGNTCNAQQHLSVNYAFITAEWCFDANNYMDIDAIHYTSYYDNSPVRFAVAIHRGDTFQELVTYTSGGTITYAQTKTLNIFSFAKRPTGWDLYLRITMIPDVGNQVVWRVAPQHYTGHGSFLPTSRTTFPIWTWDCNGTA